MSRGIKFLTIKHIPSRTAKQLRKKLKIITDLYSRGIMIVQTILMDLELDSTKDWLMVKTVVNILATKQHVLDIER